MTEGALAEIVIVGGIICIVGAVIVYLVFRFGFDDDYREDPATRRPPPPLPPERDGPAA